MNLIKQSFKVIISVTLLLSVSLLFTVCSNSDDLAPSAEMTGYQGCKTSRTDADHENRECVQFIYSSDKTLSLIHINTVFNCCIDSVKNTFSFSDKGITIYEEHVNPNCHCLCLYDLTYEFNNIEPGIYTIEFINKSGENFSVTLDLTEPCQGEECIQRDSYPY